MDYLHLLGRVLLGGYFLMSGLMHFKSTKMLSDYAKSKNVPSPTNAVWLSGLFLVFGGLGILTATYIGWSVALLVIFLVVVSLKMHNFWTDTDPQSKMMNMTNFMKNMALAGGVLLLLSIPVWPYALNW